MKITFLVHRYWPVVGGVEKYIHELARALIHDGHHVTVIAGATRADLLEHQTHEGVEIHRFPAMRSSMRMRLWFWRHLHLFRRADVIHISNTHMLECYWRMVGLAVDRRKVFLTRHGMSYACPVPDWEKRRALRSLNLAAGVIHDGAFIEKWLGVKPDCCPDQGLSPPASSLETVTEPSPNSAAFIGRLEPDSGIGIYIDAVEMLNQQGRPFELNVYGDGSLRVALEQDAQAKRLPVYFHGRTADAQRHLQDACFAFLDGRMAIQEAMARQRLVFAAYVDPLKRDYVGTEPFSPYLVAVGNAAELAEMVAHYADHEPERRVLVQEAYNHALTLTWQRTAKAYGAIWRQRLAQPAPCGSWLALLRTVWILNRETHLPKEQWALPARRRNPRSDRTTSADASQGVDWPEYVGGKDSNPLREGQAAYGGFKD